MDQRKREILYAIVESYIYSPVPVGSRKISKEFDLGISSATIRNEMSDLEDMGYLNKTHSSSGRVPSDLAYRFYVDELLLNLRNLYASPEIQENYSEISMSQEELLESVVNHLADATRSIAYVLAPKPRDTSLRYLKIVPIDKNLLLTIMVGNHLGIVEKNLIHLKKDMEEEQVEYISEKLSAALVGVDFASIETIDVKLTGELKEYEDVILQVIEIANAVAHKADEEELYAKGHSYLLEYEEFQDIDRVRALLSYLDDKDSLLEILRDLPDVEGLTVRIGSENEEEIMQENSLISTIFTTGDSITGHIGLIGPVRMNYLKLFQILMNQTNELLEKLNRMN